MRFKNWFWGVAVVLAALAFLLAPVLAYGFPLPVPGGPKQGAPATLPDGHPVIRIDPANRVQNILEPDKGICWWACAEMVGRQYGIAPLDGLCVKVQKTGIGWHTGATDAAIEHWHKEMNLPVQVARLGKTQEMIAWIRERLDEGRPVLAEITVEPGNPRTKHIILLTYLSYQRKEWTDGKGFKTTDFVLQGIDPNKAKDVFERPWQAFWDHFNGVAWAYTLPKAPPPVEVPDRPALAPPVAAPPPIAPGGKVVDPKVLARVAAQTAQPTQLNNPFNSANPFQLGVVIDPPGGHPLLTGKVESNQDIKDGVRRPSDVLETSAFGQYYFGGYDYYAEFKEKVRTGQIKLPGEKK